MTIFIHTDDSEKHRVFCATHFYLKALSKPMMNQSQGLLEFISVIFSDRKDHSSMY